MVQQASIADGSDESSPYAERRRQYEIRDATKARDDVPYKQEDGEGGKSESESFGHVFSKLQSSRRERRFFPFSFSTLQPPRTAAGAYNKRILSSFLFLTGASSSFGQRARPHSAQREGAKQKRLAERPFTVVQGRPAGRGIRRRSSVKRTKIPKTNCVFGDLSRIRLA